jgi:hypothetical protein
LWHEHGGALLALGASAAADDGGCRTLAALRALPPGAAVARSSVVALLLVESAGLPGAAVDAPLCRLVAEAALRFPARVLRDAAASRCVGVWFLRALRAVDAEAAQAVAADVGLHRDAEQPPATGDPQAPETFIAFCVVVEQAVSLLVPSDTASPGVCTKRDRCGAAYDVFDTIVLALAVSDAAAAVAAAAATARAAFLRVLALMPLLGLRRVTQTQLPFALTAPSGIAARAVVARSLSLSQSPNSRR